MMFLKLKGATMKAFPWWTEEQKAFAEEVRAFAKEVAAREEVTRWTR